MLIESLIKRPKAPITLGDRTYFFTPVGDEKSAHIAEVDNDDDIGTLLAIKEGYRLYREPAPKVAAPKVAAPPADDEDTYDLLDLLKQSAKVIEAELPSLSDDEKAELLAAETAGKARKTVLAMLGE